MRYNEVSTNLKSRRLLPSRLRRATFLSEEGFSLAPLYHKSAEKTSSLPIFICVSVGETCGLPRANTVRPYRVLPCSENILMRTLLKGGFFVCRQYEGLQTIEHPPTLNLKYVFIFNIFSEFFHTAKII